MSLEIVLQKKVSKRDWKCLLNNYELSVPVSYRNHHFDGLFSINDRIVFQNDTIFLTITNRQKTQQIESVNTRKL